MPKDSHHREARAIIEAIATPLGMMNDDGDCMLCNWPIAVNSGEHAPYCPVYRARSWLQSLDGQSARGRLWQRGVDHAS